MASMTLLEASKLSTNPLARGVLTAIATSDELTAILPMVPKRGESFVYNREKALPDVEFVAPDHSSIAESGATFDEVTVPLRMIVSDVDVRIFSADQQSELNQQRAVQIEKKLKALGRKIGDRGVNGNYATSVAASAGIAGITIDGAGPNQDTSRHGPAAIKYTHTGTLAEYRGAGDIEYGPQVDIGTNGTYVLESSNPNKTLTITVVAASLAANGESILLISSTTNEWDGLKRLCPTSQTIASTGANGDALSFEVMDEMIDEKVKVRDNLYFVCNGAIKRQYLALLRATGGATPENMAIPGINRPVPMYRGIPIIQSDWIASDESKGSASDLSSLYLVSVGAEEGFYMGVRQNGSRVPVDLDPRQASIMGVSVREIGELEDKEATRTRVSFYGATALGSELAIARASELTTS